MGTEKDDDAYGYAAKMMAAYNYEPVPYGTILEHPYIRGLRYMVVGPGGDRYSNLEAMVISEAPRISSLTKIGSIVLIEGQRNTAGRSTWIVCDE